jgi:hypothetical protein
LACHGSSYNKFFLNNKLLLLIVVEFAIEQATKEANGEQG